MTVPPPLPLLNIPAILRRYGLRPQKNLGQNFLTEDSALRKVISAAGITPDETVLEVGPGLGSLTRYLAVLAERVVAVELDRKLIPPLQEILAHYKNIHISHGDILEQNLTELLALPEKGKSIQHYVVVANIPYYITSALIRHLLDSPLQPDRIILTVQKEVAMRICAEPPEMSLLALSVQVFGNPSLSAIIPAEAFYPTPQVDSAVLRVDIFSSPRISPPFLDTFFQLAKAGFSQKRKNLRNSLSGGLGISKSQVETMLAAVHIDYHRRAETLTMEEWRALTLQMKEG